MKIHHNIIAASILGASMIIALIIYANMPQPGRYVYKETTDANSTECYIFDTAKGTRYSRLIISSSSIDTWNVITLTTWKERVRRTGEVHRACDRIKK